MPDPIVNDPQFSDGVEPAGIVRPSAPGSSPRPAYGFF